MTGGPFTLVQYEIEVCNHHELSARAIKEGIRRLTLGRSSCEIGFLKSSVIDELEFGLITRILTCFNVAEVMVAGLSCVGREPAMFEEIWTLSRFEGTEKGSSCRAGVRDVEEEKSTPREDS
jgi:hypothetical protein